MTLLGKFTQILSGKVSFRESESKNRTKEDYEILKIENFSKTEFGIQGILTIWVGDGSDSEFIDSYGDSGWVTDYFHGFQDFLIFYTLPTDISKNKKLVLCTPEDSWTSFEMVIIDEIECSRESVGEVSNASAAEDFLSIHLLEKYKLIKISDEFLNQYIPKNYL